MAGAASFCRDREPPQARQVADRFHLMQNLRVAIEEQMSLAGRATGRALLPDKSIGSAQIDLIQDDPHVDATHRRRVRHRQSRQAVFGTVHALNKPTSPLYFEAFLAACWKDGNRCGRHLFHDIKQRGYTGSFSNLERLLASWRRSERSVEGSASSAPIISHQRGRGVVPIRDPETGHVISPVVAAALCMKPRSMLTITQARKVDALKQGAPEFALMRSLGMRFRGIFRSRDPGKLDSWIDDAVNSGLVAVARFARVLHRDLDAVYSAIELPWSNGQAEGQINRLKTIKRAMYGRAGPELLRARMLPLEQNRHHTK
uniref:Hypothetical transposase n=1 Tax=Sinorhizobium meliloti (strain SM11) TaxID=707241 RepID=Q1WLF2_SINMM|nr:hypothetical transposase [Sinorhizobium meliloti]